MNLLQCKDCIKCMYSLVYGNKESYTVKCTSDDYEIQKLFAEDNRYCAPFCRCYKPVSKKRDGTINQDKAMQFVTAGNSEFIMHSTKTNDDFRFIINKQLSNNKSNEDKYIYFVNIIRGNTKEYCGVMWIDKDTDKFTYSQGKNGKVAADSIEIRSLLFVLNKLYAKENVENLELYSIGKCGYCGKELETQEELETGIHKKCINSIH